MKRKTAAIVWPAVALLLALALGFVLAASRRPDPVQVEVVTRSGPSAAATLSLALFGVLGFFALAAVGTVVVALVVIRARQHTQRMEQAALLFGARQPQPASRPRPQVGSGDGPSIVVIGGQGTPRVEDLRNGRNW